MTRTERPALQVPAGAVDAHGHAFAPPSRYAPVEQRMYEIPDATADKYLQLLDRLGVAHGVIVAASAYGIDNRPVLDALAAAPERLRGVAHLDLSVDEATLAQFHEAGVRGVRINLAHPAARFVEPGDVPRLAHMVAPFGWHIEFVVLGEQITELVPMFRSLPVDMTFGHLGYLPVDRGTDFEDLRLMVDLLRDGRAWLKLTGWYRVSREPGPPYTDVNDLVGVLVDEVPDRLLWGTDWPHAWYDRVKPDDVALLDQLASWVTDEKVRRAILVDNPTALYDF